MRRIPALLFSCLLLFSLSLRAEEIFGLTNNGKLVRFDSASPGTIISTVTISGLQASETLLGIDFRPETGELFGVGSTNRVYKIDVVSGAAKTVGTGAAFTPVLNGANIGVDFNPSADALRTVTNNAQNLRLLPDTGTAATDTVLAYNSQDPQAGVAPNIVSVAYTNNVTTNNSGSGNAQTTLYALDSNQGNLAIIGSLNGTISPNGGVLTTIGKLGVSFAATAGFDISGQTGTAYASLNVTGATKTALYTINLATGTATKVGDIGGSDTVVDISVLATPTPFNMVALRTGTPSTLIRFNVAAPGTVSTAVTVTGLQAGDTKIEQIDYRPANGALYGLSDTFKLYTIDPGTGVATFVGGPVAPTPTSHGYGFNFNPVADKIRFVSDVEQNLRIDPTTGLLTAADTALTYATGDVNQVAGANPNVNACTYTNAANGATTLYALDTINTLPSQNCLVMISNPNSGVMTTIGTVNTTLDNTNTGFDIAPNGTAYISLGGTNQLFTLNLTNAQATLVGTIGGGGNIRAIAAVPDAAKQTFAFAAATSTTVEGQSTAIVVNRTGATSGVASVDYAFTAGTATAGTDFPLVRGTLTFLNGEASRTIIVPIPTDTTLELFETVIVTLSNPIGGILGTQSTHTLNIADKDDIDGDGFTNDIETNFGSDPASATSSPFGGAAAGTAQPLTVAQFGIKLNFAKAASDSVSFGGTLALPDSFNPSGQKIVINVNSVGGIVKTLTLDPKGRSPKGNDSFAVAKPKNGTAKFGVKLQKGDFFDALKSVGFTKDLSVKDLDAKIQLDVYINNTLFRASPDILIATSKGKSASAKLKKK